MSDYQGEVKLHHLVTDFARQHRENGTQAYVPQVTEGAISRYCTDDVYEHACNITAWQQLYDQLRPGRFSGELTEIWLEGLQFFQEYTSIALRQSCLVWPDAIWIGLPLQGQEGYIGSQLLDEQHIAVRPGGTEFELNTPNDYTIMGVVVDQRQLQHYLHLQDEEGETVSHLMGSESLLVNPQQKQLICHFLQEALCAGENYSLGMRSRAVRKVLLHNLLDGMLNLLLSARPSEPRLIRSQQTMQRVVTHARDYILAHGDQVITIVDLCRHLHVSRRTLQNCFQQRLGISPNSYLKAIRLNAVRRELVSSYSPWRTVQEAAAAWGFWHMSQLAVDYYRLFGERPSDTLADRGKLQRRWI
ncbi:MAG: HTH-type transcriptional regulator EutR [Enterobacteriaceae bacterium]